MVLFNVIGVNLEKYTYLHNIINPRTVNCAQQYGFASIIGVNLLKDNKQEYLKERLGSEDMRKISRHQCVIIIEVLLKNQGL